MGCPHPHSMLFCLTFDLFCIGVDLDLDQARIVCQGLRSKANVKRWWIVFCKVAWNKENLEKCTSLGGLVSFWASKFGQNVCIFLWVPTISQISTAQPHRATSAKLQTSQEPPQLAQIYWSVYGDDVMPRRNLIPCRTISLFKETVGYIILADLWQIKIYSSFDHYAALIILNLG